MELALIILYIGQSQFTRVDAQAVCDSVSVTFQVFGHIDGVCNYILHGISPANSSITKSESQEFFTYTFSANKNYSIVFEVFTTAGAVNVSYDIFTTYDVQRLSVEKEVGRGVIVRGEFLSGSRAVGCLVVLQGPPTSPDILFRALLRTQSQETVSTTVPVPPSTYSVYGYDLEENGLPNTMPAVILEGQIVNTSDIADSVKPSLYLKSGSISRRGSTIVVDCEFSEVYPEASCVLVYREYGSLLLTVVDIPQLFDFPVSITVDNPKIYTFALFGKNDAMSLDEAPLVYTKFSDSDDQEETDKEKGGKQNSQAPVVAISVGTVVVCVLVCGGSAVLLLVKVRHYYSRSKSPSDAGLQTKNVVYDEVVLPPTTTTSSVIPTEPNTAYVTTQTTTIPTDQNVAYGVHTSS
ncbi:hypothetical protein GBAR_LOCUS24791 [Geodia barretti]|uniref:Uncharacterized protein n=1 Tax=Geodia barretti TaxID=519541 RepID=A0AA35TCP5_GEOBA|nr:hypothetical protein GBAR_LOCUS24791 [Geodia barretti]